MYDTCLPNPPFHLNSHLSANLIARHKPPGPSFQRGGRRGNPSQPTFHQNYPKKRIGISTRRQIPCRFINQRTSTSQYRTATVSSRSPCVLLERFTANQLNTLPPEPQLLSSHTHSAPSAPRPLSRTCESPDRSRKIQILNLSLGFERAAIKQ